MSVVQNRWIDLINCVPIACCGVIVAVIVMHVFIIGLISAAASCTRRQALHIDSVMSQGSVVVVLLFPFPPTLSKMVASSPVLTFELCRPVLCWCLTGF